MCYNGGIGQSFVLWYIKKLGSLSPSKILMSGVELGGLMPLTRAGQLADMAKIGG